MRVSVIVPVYNDSRVASCISSLLLQDYPSDLYEVIVIDNNSAAAVSEIPRRFPVTYLREERQGSYFARNRGLEIAAGDIAAFIDADCVAHPGWLKNLVRGFEDWKIGGVGGKILKLPPRTWVQAAAEDLAEQQVAPQSFPFFPYPYIVTANAAYRMGILHELGGFDTRFQSGGDVDLSGRIQQRGYRIVVAPDAIVYHDARESVKGYFRQYFGYAAGHALLFKKYRHSMGRSMFVNTYPLRGLIVTLCCLLLRLFGGQRATKRGSVFLALVKYTALICGNLYGSIKHRILFL